LFAGADNIIVSLWKVSDKSTTKLMYDFYRFLTENNENKSDALHKAKLNMIENTEKEWAHPFFWSPFILIGS
jgi:CHAT domain-containing protein